MRRSRLLVGASVALLAALVVAVAAAHRSGGDPIRIGVLVDCSGALAATKEPVLAGAALPLLDHGGTRHVDGHVTGAQVGGREVELIPACTEYTYFHLLAFATRRLVEQDGVDIVVGPIGGGEGIVFRELASLYPQVTFLEGASGAQAATLRDPQPNLFRFVPDDAQLTAGLGTYAFRDLGWRRAVVVGEPFSDGWELSAGFVAEFCALGGDVVERDWTSLLQPNPSAAAKRHASEADGVLVASSISPASYLKALSTVIGPLEKRVLLTGFAFFDPQNTALPGVDLRSVVIGGYIPLDPKTAGMQAFRSHFEQTFPGLLPGRWTEPVVVPTYSAVQAVVSALQRTGGRLGTDQRELRTALATLRLDAPQGPVRLDRNRQAVAPTYLERVEHAKGGSVRMSTTRTIPQVDQAFGGIFTTHTPSPSPIEPRCRRRPLPRWAR